MFTPLRYESGKMMKLPLAVSQTITKGTTLIWASGYLSIGTTTSTDVRFVAMEDVTTDGSSHTEILVLPVEGVEFEVGCDGVVSIVDRGTYADLATGATINPDLSSYDAFYISEIVGEAEVSTTVRGHFVHALE
jgi:hypothetical protein